MSSIMTQDSPINKDLPELSRRQQIIGWMAFLLLIYLLILGVSVISRGFRAAMGDEAEALFALASNPFLGLMVGIMSTALIQSSSATTSIIVSLVAGGLPVAIAIPMIMGANIGTSVTNTLVSLGHIGNKNEFKLAFSAATVLDLFNLLAVAIFFPLEIMFGFLERLSLSKAYFFLGDADLNVDDLDFVGALVNPLRDLIRSVTNSLLPEPFNAILQVIIGMGIILFSIYYLGKVMKRLMVGKAQEIMDTAIGRGPLSGVLSGILITILMQSSSATTSLMVPLAGLGVLTLAQIYPFTIGANIGTTVTSLLAATSVTGPTALPALQIAFVHVLFNLLAALLIFFVPFLYRIPLSGAQKLATAAAENKFLALAYVLGVFFVIPGILLGASLLFA
jgi:sodium-dependent phosphate cotransporter